MAIKAPTSNDTELRELMNDVKNGKIQLPEFQRGWTWDDGRIRAILASLSQGYPMGAIMQLQYGNEDIKFKYRPIEGVVLNCKVVPEYLALDGQQRLTSMYRATVSKEPVETNTEKGKAIKRFYYLDINKCLDENEERLDAVMSVPEDRKIKTNFDRDILLDISERELEYRQEMFPINIIFDSNEREDWADGYKEYYNYDAEYMKKYKAFRKEIIDVIVSYKLPVISLDKSTPREAVCKVFENVNTGGVALTVFELVTAMFATYEFDLRNDWEKCRQVIWGENEQLNTDVMYGVDETAFLTTITLYSSYCEKVQSGDDSRKGVSCKKKDVLNLNFESYKKNKSIVLEGYKLARVFLFTQHVFRKRDLPYTTQIIPLAAICAYIGKSSFDKPKTQDILSQWFWCGIMGEMYGGANETRYANDIEDVVAAIEGRETLQRTVNAASFSSTRLLSLQTRNSAAYKGIMALIYKAKCQDFMNGTTMDVVKSMDGSPDIHHIFPEGYCMKMSYDKVKWNSIINKTPILASTNRSIGGVAPSIYVGKIKKEAEIDDGTMRTRVESHLVDYDLLISDDFEEYFVNRARQLLVLIEQAMKKSISDRGSEETIKAFGCSLE